MRILNRGSPASKKSVNLFFIFYLKKNIMKKFIILFVFLFFLYSCTSNKATVYLHTYDNGNLICLDLGNFEYEEEVQIGINELEILESYEKIRIGKKTFVQYNAGFAQIGDDMYCPFFERKNKENSLYSTSYYMYEDSNGKYVFYIVYEVKELDGIAISGNNPIIYAYKQYGTKELIEYGIMTVKDNKIELIKKSENLVLPRKGRLIY